jgi:hypothetical protein
LRQPLLPAVLKEERVALAARKDIDISTQIETVTVQSIHVLPYVISPCWPISNGHIHFMRCPSTQDTHNTRTSMLSLFACPAAPPSDKVAAIKSRLRSCIGHTDVGHMARRKLSHTQRVAHHRIYTCLQAPLHIPWHAGQGPYPRATSSSYSLYTYEGSHTHQELQHPLPKACTHMKVHTHTWSCKMRSSMVPAMVMRTTCTARFWPVSVQQAAHGVQQFR